MLNYDLKFGVAATARIFNVHSDTVKTWSFKFSEYLKPNANPPKGNPRSFTIEDIRVLAYVFYYWEQDPDIECIKLGLNTDNHFEDIYTNFLTEIIPLFHDLPENYDSDNNAGVLFGGLAEYGDIFELAASYKLAGDRLVEIALENGEQFELLCPAIYNYRHSTELYLKASLDSFKKTHDLLALMEQFRETVKKKFNSELPHWFTSTILVFNDFDPESTVFRYGETFNRDEIFIDLHHVKKLMGWLANVFNKVQKLKEEQTP